MGTEPYGSCRSGERARGEGEGEGGRGKGEGEDESHEGKGKGKGHRRPRSLRTECDPPFMRAISGARNQYIFDASYVNRREGAMEPHADNRNESLIGSRSRAPSNTRMRRTT